MCGRKIEKYNDFNINYRFGYESRHDGDGMELDLCGSCLDKFTQYLIDNCTINPVIDNSIA